MNGHRLVQRLSRRLASFTGIASLLLLVLFTAASAFSQTNPCAIGSDLSGCGDTRWPGLNPVVTEPSFPALCTTVVGTSGEPAGKLYALQSATSLKETALDTTRLQAAINACKPAQGAPAVGLELALNPGNSADNAFLSGPITLQPGVTLIVDADITLFGSTTATYSNGDFISVASNHGSTLTQYSGGAMGYLGHHGLRNH
jgi:polygalacturonase